MEEVVRGEMAEDALADERFRRAHFLERVVLCVRQFLSLKKYCILSFVLALILAIQALGFLAPFAFKAEDLDAGRNLAYKTWQDYFRKNGSDKVRICAVYEVEPNSTGDA